jgi:hypothetical protein
MPDIICPYGGLVAELAGRSTNAQPHRAAVGGMAGNQKTMLARCKWPAAMACKGVKGSVVAFSWGRKMKELPPR